MIFDTPGFTSFEVLEAEEDELQFLYPEFADIIGSCRYDNCRHLKEPGCKVREAVRRGKDKKGTLSLLCFPAYRDKRKRKEQVFIDSAAEAGYVHNLRK